MTLIIENVKEEFVPAIKELSNAINANIQIKQDKKTQLDLAIEEVERGEVVRYKDFESFKKAILDEVSN
ncbi:hypothetical protein [Helicobacter sp. 11S02596-1]|uniref:hypothetical protein n=1 Tax=Helicobacter sp. 11S02596-1 TaxID=1476194 RepID=UPI000BA65848|nr:hypothetical protein [Helicobacter sp. 11S02596-1]PAF43622.1 hypothetical protein BJI48_05040 [Helicobacter sp. 11S02596-1]